MNKMLASCPVMCP
jgi:hypothetical protein